jgi:anti-sigma B factor antagonist
MTAPQPQRWLHVEVVDDIAVVRFVQPRILDEEVIDHLGSELIRFVEQDGCRRMVLVFAQVDAMATHMLGELLVLHKKMKSVGGRLVLCEFRPSLREVFDLLKLDTVFHLVDTEEEALKRC